MNRLLNGFLQICLLLLVFFLFFCVIGGISWMVLNTDWLNLLWIAPTFLGMCWIMGDE